MKQKVLLTFLCLFTLSGAVFPQVKLETEILSQYYCPGDNDLDGLSLNLKLKYTNIGAQPIILTKDSLGIGQMIVTKNDNGIAGTREMNVVYTLISSSEWNATAGDLNRLFVTLKPNETFVTKAAARVFVWRENRSAIAGAVGNGQHFLQLGISTWPGSPETAEQLQVAWKDKGSLQTDSIVSAPMTFTVVPKRKLTKCR